MISSEDLSRHPRTDEMLRTIITRYPLYRRTAGYIRARFDREYLALAEEILGIMETVSPGASAHEARVRAFTTYSQEFLILQARLEREGRYRFDKYSEVSSYVYQHPRMREYYLDGLLLSQILWPNHYRILRLLGETVARIGSLGRVLDIPCGTGLQSYLLATRGSFETLRSVDVSPFAVEYTQKVLRASTGAEELSRRISVELCDVFALPPAEKFEFIVCGELLEHLEEPARLLGVLRRLLSPKGTVFLTTAIYAAAIDHIYLFRSVEEVREMISGFFSIRAELVLPLSLGGYHPGMERVPINYACALAAS